MIRTTEELIEAAGQRGLNLDPASIHPDESGLDFLAFHARDRSGTSWILRALRRPDVIPVAEGENRVLSVVRPRLPVAVPNWQILDAELIGYPRLPGEPAAVMNVPQQRFDWVFDPESPPAAFVESLAEALAALHRIDPEVASAAGLEVISPSGVRDELAVQMDHTREVLEVPERVWHRWQEWLSDDSYWPEHSAFTHGDLHPGHILVDPEHRVTGLLDWTEGRVTDPSVDFVIHYAALGEAALRVLLDRYAQAGGRVWPRMAEHVMERWRANAVPTAMFAERSGSDGVLEFARECLAAVDRELLEDAV